MAACGSLQHIFEQPLPENPTLLESLSSWNKLNPLHQPIQQSSFTEIFGELHFKENPHSPPPCNFPISSPTCIDLIPHTTSDLNSSSSSKKTTSIDSLFSTPKNHHYESLQLCTEGLGFESFDDVEDLKNEDWHHHEAKASITRPDNQRAETRRSRLRVGTFPPPISSIGKTGKPWVSFKSYRHDGRFVLKQVKIPSQEFLHAQREDGRLKLHFVQPSDEIIEDDQGDEENYMEDDDDHDEDEETGSTIFKE